MKINVPQLNHNYIVKEKLLGMLICCMPAMNMPTLECYTLVKLPHDICLSRRIVRQFQLFKTSDDVCLV